MSWMDTRALPAVRPGRFPRSPTRRRRPVNITHRFTGQSRDTGGEQHPAAMADRQRPWALEHRRRVAPAAFNLSPGMLFELVMPGEALRPGHRGAAGATGIPEGLPVVATANDKAVEALGAGSLDERTALISLGTYIASMVHGRENRQDRNSSGRTSAACRTSTSTRVTASAAACGH